PESADRVGLPDPQRPASEPEAPQSPASESEAPQWPADPERPNRLADLLQGGTGPHVPEPPTRSRIEQLLSGTYPVAAPEQSAGSASGASGRHRAGDLSMPGDREQADRQPGETMADPYNVIHASSVPGDEFNGLGEQPTEEHQQDLMDAVPDAMAEAVTGHGGLTLSEHGPDVFEVGLPDGGSFTVRVELRPHDFDGAAESTLNHDDNEHVIQLSDELPVEHVKRALAHEIGEIVEDRERYLAGEPDNPPDALRPGEFEPETRLSPHDAGRVQELRVLGEDLERLPEAGDRTPEQEAFADRTLRSGMALTDHLGLRDGTPGAHERRQLVLDHVDPARRPYVERILDEAGRSEEAMSPDERRILAEVRAAAEADQARLDAVADAQEGTTADGDGRRNAHDETDVTPEQPDAPVDHDSDAFLPEERTPESELQQHLNERAREFADRRGTTVEAERQQFVLQRVMARIFTSHPDAWMIKGGQTLLARWADGRATSDIDLVGRDPNHLDPDERIMAPPTREEMVARYTEALNLDLGDHLTFELTYDGDLQHGLGARLKHTALLDGRVVGEVSVDLAPPRTRPMWEPPEMIDFPEHILSTGHPDESPQLRVISLTDTLAHKVSGMFTQGVKTEQTKCGDCLPRSQGLWSCQTGDLPYRVQDMVDTLMIATRGSFDAPTVQKMLHEEFSWRIEQGEPLRVPSKFYVPNPEWHEGFEKYASGTPGLPFEALREAVPAARAFLNPLLDRVNPATGTWDPERREWVGAEHAVGDGSAPAARQRILVVAHASGRSAGLGGLPVASGEITKALAGLDNTEVTLLTIGETEPHGDARIITVPADPGRTPRVQMLDLARKDEPVPELPPVNSDSYDVVIGHSGFSSSAAMEIRNRRYPSAALVDVLHMPMERYAEVQGNPERGLTAAKFEAVVIRNSDLTVGVGPLLTDHAMRLAVGSVRPPSFHELIPGVEVLGELGEPPSGDTLNLLFVGRAGDAIKGYDDLFNAVADLHDHDVPVHLRVRGMDDAELERQQLLADSRLGSGVIDLRGYTTDRMELLDDYRWAHAAVMPSKIEGYGLAGAEPIAHGLPTLVNEESGLGQALLDDSRFPAHIAAPSVVRDAGLLDHPERRAAAWSRALQDLHDHYDERRAAATQLKAVFEQYTRQHAARALADAMLEATPGAGNVTVQGPNGSVMPRSGLTMADVEATAQAAEAAQSGAGSAGTASDSSATASTISDTRAPQPPSAGEASP
ncbi:glycosyltransferase family 4 protein, partial [Rugosimonospora africana]|uniref:glycosyltransferase family 4 protein n=1 Tax=Rugosimonospora africana TaxID=556532 RepID=UPI001944A2A7